MDYLNNLKTALKEVYSSKAYYFITFLVAFVIFSFNASITNYKLLFSHFSIKIFFSIIFGTIMSMYIISLILLTAMSILSGIVLSMGVYLVKRQIKGSVGASSSSIIISIIAPSCPSCAIGLLSLLGLGGFLSVLPFKGLEIGFLGVIILMISIFYLSKKIVTKVCSL